MPFTPYHFGPNGFIALTFRKWLDVPVFLLVNVAVDVEVLVVGAFELGWRRHPYCHTLLLGAVLGIVCALAAWPVRGPFKRLMNLFRIPYRPTLPKMLISGVLGIWLHVFIDALHHFDVRLFWPNRDISLWRNAQRHFGVREIKLACLAFFLAAIVPYILAVRSFIRQDKTSQ